MRFEKSTEPRNFNLMLKTSLGPVDDGRGLRTCGRKLLKEFSQILRNVLDATSRKLPFGMAQMGKAFRNEVTPRNFIFRVCEFEQMELEFFVKPGQMKSGTANGLKHATTGG